MPECCFCKEDVGGYGNNPAPVKQDANAVCCNLCNMKIVIPMRFANILDDLNKK